MVLSGRLRTFEVDGRSYAHASQVPLSCLSASPGLMTLLRRFARPGKLSDIMGCEPTDADVKFFSMLHRVGILLDADKPDPLHTMSLNRSAVSSLLLYPTSVCNLRCVYCHAASGAKAGAKMSPEYACAAVDTFFQSLDQQAKSVALIFHGGGEPTTNVRVMTASWERFSRIADERKLPAFAQTITNGVFGTEVLRLLQEPDWRVTLSYDGVRQNAQRRTTANRDTRAVVIANLRALRDSGKTLSTRATLTRDGLLSMRELVDDAREIGISRVQVEPSSRVGRGADLPDGPPDPEAFATSFLDAFYHALRSGVALSTSAWSHIRVGDGRYCGAITGNRGVTPDGFLSACTEVCDGSVPEDPFIVGVQRMNQRPEIWPEREEELQRRVGYQMPQCRSCFMVDTCAGGCASRARARSGDIRSRDEAHCTMARQINARLMADLADGKLLPDIGWQPVTAELEATRSAHPGVTGRLVALVPPFARSRWNADVNRRPFFPLDKNARRFFHQPQQTVRSI